MPTARGVPVALGLSGRNGGVMATQAEPAAGQGGDRGRFVKRSPAKARNHRSNASPQNNRIIARIAVTAGEIVDGNLSPKQQNHAPVSDRVSLKGAVLYIKRH